MADVTRLVPADLLRILLCTEEVPAVDIIHITVIIIVDSVTCNLPFVHPHVFSEVRVSILHTFVAHSHDDAWITCCKTPGILDIDIGTCS